MGNFAFFDSVDKTKIDIFIILFRYDHHRDEDEFTQREQECNICFTQQTGRTFIRIQPCKHHFCRDCVDEYCRTHIKDGNVLNLKYFLFIDSILDLDLTLSVLIL